MLGYIVLLFSLPNYANSIGLTAHQGSIVGAILNLGQGLGRPPVGYFSDSFGRINMAAFMTFLSGLFSLVIWVNAKSFGASRIVLPLPLNSANQQRQVLIFYALIGGTVAGTFWPTAGPVTAEVTGLSQLPAALSITWVNLVLPTTFSEPIALEIAERTGSYLGAQLFTGFMYITAAFCLWMLKAWKIGDLEMQAEAARGRPVERSSVMKRLLKVQKV